MKIEIFKHEIFGDMHVFGDDGGLWFSLYEVSDPLDITRERASFKFKHVDKNLKKTNYCLIESLDPDFQDHRFIHEKVVYELMCIGKSPLCDEFRKWISNIASEFDWLNMHCNSSQLGLWGDVQTNYNVVKTYIDKVKDDSPFGEAAKHAMTELDDAFRTKHISDNYKPVIKEKSYRTDYTIDEAMMDPNFNPSLLFDDEYDSLTIQDQSDEQRQELIDAFDEGRLIEYKIEKRRKGMSDEEREILYKRHKGQKSSCPSWLKEVIK